MQYLKIKCLKIYNYIKNIINYIKSVISLIKSSSYYPEEKAKSFLSQLIDILKWRIKEKESNPFYKAYGLDLKKNKQKTPDYIGYLYFMNARDNANKKGNKQILRNKFLFYKYMKSQGIHVPEVFAYIKDGKVYNTDEKEIDFSELSELKDYFIKDIDGECASFVKHIKDFNELSEIKNKISNGSYLIQERVFQAEKMCQINPTSVNTLRIVTKMYKGKPFVFSSLLRVGTSKTGNVDNWAAGGLAIGIEDNGNLKKYGYYKPKYGTKTDVHPDTGIVFKDFTIPMFEEAKAYALKAHEVLKDMDSIGWDITITEKGIVFIEGNDNWEITLHQMCDKPLRHLWESTI